MDKKIIRHAEKAKSIWEEFIKNSDNKRVSKYFHLRPTSSGITIVSTLPDYEMRGIPEIKDEKKLLAKLNNIKGRYAKITSLDIEKRRKVMKDLEFKSRSKGKNVLEETIQATMINTMSQDGNLSKKLGSQGKYVRFIASELFFEKGPNKVDIVGHDGKDLYFFELKKGRTTKVEQVAKYVEYYKNKRDRIAKLLKSYPVNSVEMFEKIRGVMVMEDADNSESRNDWRKLAREFKITILFYSPSLKYRRIA